MNIFTMSNLGANYIAMIALTIVLSIIVGTIWFFKKRRNTDKNKD